MLKFGNEERQAKTDAAMRMPLAGDVFTEMLSFWVFVVSVTPRAILTIEANPPCRLPRGGKLRTYSPPEEFAKHFAYGRIAGYWVSLHRSGQNVEGWAEAHRAREEAVGAAWTQEVEVPPFL